jgi:hypothetical protein
MATTTTNYGFDVPTSSDLVKNGATQIALLGQDLDTFLFRPFSRNALINGGMDVWQRGTTGLGTTSGSYTADRWLLGQSSTTVTQDTDSPVSPYFKYSLKMVGTGDNSIIQRLESLNSIILAGQTVTFSFYAKRTAGAGALDVRFYYPTVVDNFTSVTQIGSTVVVSASPSSSWTRYTVTAAIGTNITAGLQVQIYNTGASTTFITGTQLEIGSQVTPFTRAGLNFGGELAMCQRYFLKWSQPQFSRAGFIYADTTTSAIFVDKLPVPLRSSPTITFTNMTANGNAITAASLASISDNNNTVGLNLTTSGVLANVVYQLYVASGQTGVIAYSSEL